MTISKRPCTIRLLATVAVSCCLSGYLTVPAAEADGGVCRSMEALPRKSEDDAIEGTSSLLLQAPQVAPEAVSVLPETAPPQASAPASTAARPTVSPAYVEHYSRGFRLDPREFTFTQKYFWSRLVRPTRNDAFWGAGLFGLAAVLARGRNHIQDEVAKSSTPDRRAFFEDAQTLGDQGIVPGIALLFYLGGSTFGDYRAKETGFMLAESALLTGVLTAVGQFVLSEDRPSDGGKFHLLRGLGHGVSGHASTAASISGVLASMYLRNRPEDGPVKRTFKWIGKGAAYGVPLLVAYARVDRQQHFAYNTILGIGIGYWVSHVVADAHRAYLENPHPRWQLIAVGPIGTEEGDVGFGATFDFRLRPRGSGEGLPGPRDWLSPDQASCFQRLHSVINTRAGRFQVASTATPVTGF